MSNLWLSANFDDLDDEDCEACEGTGNCTVCTGDDCEFCGGKNECAACCGTGIQDYDEPEQPGDFED